MAIDMSKVKGESSTEFGKSLLAETQASNARINKANNKANQRSALIKVGLGAADMFVAKQADALLMNEENTKNTIQTKLAWQNSQEIAATEATAQAYAGGYDAYWNAQGEASAEIELKTKYGTQGNTLQRKELVTQRGAIFGNYNKENHLARLKANEAYLASGGGEGAYLKALKLTTPRTVMGKITNYIGEKSGLTADAEIAQNAQNILTSAQALNAFQETYKTSKNSTIAIALAKEVDALPEKLRPKSVTLSDVMTYEETDILNRVTKTPYYIAQQEQDDGSITRTTVGVDMQPISLRSFQNQNNFSSVVAQATQKEEIVALGSSVVSKYLSADEKDILNERIDSELGNFNLLEKNAKAKAKATAATRIHSRVGVMTYQAQRNLGLTARQGSQLAVEMLRLDMTATGTGASAEGIGKFNPYNTLTAMSNMENREPGNWRYVDSVSRVVGLNGENLFTSYLDSTALQREQMDAAVAGIKLDEKTTKDLVNFHRIAQKISKLPKGSYGSFKQAVEIVTQPDANLKTINAVAAGTGSQAPQVKEADVLTFDSTQTYSLEQLKELMGSTSSAAISMNNKLKSLYEMQKENPTDKRVGTAIVIAQQQFQKIHSASKAGYGNPKVRAAETERQRLRKEEREAAKVKRQAYSKKQSSENLLSSFE
tara:strand:+ start:148 stop:2124 length:1977 start_codon:yes stop_codon:yes gene_type:complete